MKTKLWRLAATLFLAGCSKDGTPAPEAEGGEGAVDIFAPAAERAGIRTEKVKRQRLSSAISAPAEVMLDPDRTAHLGPLVPARVGRVAVRLGDRVRPGSLLAVLHNVAAGENRAATAQAEAELDLARANLRRQEELRAAGIGAERAREEAVAALRRAEAALAAAQDKTRVVGSAAIRSPIAGTVIERHATVGETVGPEDELFTVGDLSRVWVVGQVYERDVGAVRALALARLTLEAYPGRVWEGHLAYVAGVLQHETRTLPVRLELKNPDGALKPGLFGALQIEASDAVDALAVPAAAVQRLGERALVFVREADDGDRLRFRARTVALGREAGGLVEVKDGLREDEVVAVSGTFTLKGQMLRDTLAEEE